MINPEYYNMSYKKEQIDMLLLIIRECIKNKKYSISMNENRRENIEFANTYNLTSEEQRKILLRIDTKDFCHSLQNTNKGYEHEVLYVFLSTGSID